MTTIVWSRSRGLPADFFARLCRCGLPVLVLFVALGIYRLAGVRPEQERVVLPRRAPVVIGARYADERVVTDEQLAAVLDRVKPPAGPAHTNNYVHALRLWGPDADFGGSKIPGGSELRDYFLDFAAFRRRAGENAPPLFYRGRDGIEVRSYDDRVTDRNTSSFHTDDLVATLAEIGMPLDATLRLSDGEATVGDLLATSLSRFHLDQLEYEWTAIAYARYVFPQPEWQNKYGQIIDVDALVEELIEHPPHLGPCNGLHRLEALVVLYRADEQFHALRSHTKRKMLAYMKRISNAVVAAQAADGYWAPGWQLGTAGAAPEKGSGPTLHEKLLVTGHHLEWLALAPAEVQPPRETIVRAGQWLARTLVEMDEKALIDAYGPYTHAARALCLWRGVEPYAFWKNHQTKN